MYATDTGMPTEHICGHMYNVYTDAYTEYILMCAYAMYKKMYMLSAYVSKVISIPTEFSLALVWCIDY